MVGIEVSANESEIIENEIAKPREWNQNYRIQSHLGLHSQNLEKPDQLRLLQRNLHIRSLVQP